MMMTTTMTRMTLRTKIYFDDDDDDDDDVPLAHTNVMTVQCACAWSDSFRMVHEGDGDDNDNHDDDDADAEDEHDSLSPLKNIFLVQRHSLYLESLCQSGPSTRTAADNKFLVSVPGRRPTTQCRRK